jgi:hypothetical protein
MKIAIATMESIVVNNAASDGGRLAASGCFCGLVINHFSHFIFEFSLSFDYSFLLFK